MRFLHRLYVLLANIYFMIPSSQTTVITRFALNAYRKVYPLNHPVLYAEQDSNLKVFLVFDDYLVMSRVKLNS